MSTKSNPGALPGLRDIAAYRGPDDLAHAIAKVCANTADGEDFSVVKIDILHRSVYITIIDNGHKYEYTFEVCRLLKE